MSIQQHYDTFLAPHYTWICGGQKYNILQATRFFEDIELPPGKGQLAVDLGAGSGFQSIALAKDGYQVNAFDLCPALLDELAQSAAGLPVTGIQADFSHFRDHLKSSPALITCMGDSLLHLPNLATVALLLSHCKAALEGTGGSLLLRWRDFSTEKQGPDRFIPLAQDQNRIFTSFLEYEDQRVWVNDFLYHYHQNQWHLTSSRYPKLRLSRAWVEGRLSELGFHATRSETNKGLHFIWADLPAQLAPLLKALKKAKV